MKAPRVTLDQWRTLQAVVDHGGFAQAAEALHRSQIGGLTLPDTLAPGQWSWLGPQELALIRP